GDIVHVGPRQGNQENHTAIFTTGKHTLQQARHRRDKIARQTAAMLTVDRGIITYREAQLPVALRLFTIFLGLGIAIGIPCAWTANASLSDPPPILILLAVVTLVSVGFGGFFVFLGLVSASELRID